jgi:hypothetical protein
MAGTGVGFGWVGVVMDNKLLENQKDPAGGPDVETRATSERDHDGVGMGDAWRANEFPQYHYGINILHRKVNILDTENNITEYYCVIGFCLGLTLKTGRVTYGCTYAASSRRPSVR